MLLDIIIVSTCTNYVSCIEDYTSSATTVEPEEAYPKGILVIIYIDR